ncbi:MAG: glycosyltransferase family 4 protein [Bacteroidetes bacterium]|nr:glycosyltransferase family 4 protein [Bacteroidota bacterium]
MKHLLFINQHYYPDYAATGQLLAELCDDLVSAGFRVTVITGFPEPGTFPSEIRPLKVEKNGILTIFRLYNHPAGNKSILNRLLHFFSFWFLSIIKSLTVTRPDLVFVMSTPPLLNGVTANLIRLIRRVPYVYNVQDLYPDIAVQMGTIRNRQLIRLSAAIENYINHHAQQIVTLSEPMKDKIVSHGVEPGKVSVIPNWSDGNLIRPVQDSPLRTEWDLRDRFVIMYSGNTGMSQGLDWIMEAMVPVAADHPDLVFVIVGGGVRLPQLKENANRNGWTFVRFFPFQPKEQLGQSLAVADLHLVPLTAGMSDYLVPSKFYGIAAAGRPTLALVDEGSEIDRIVRSQNLGFSIRHGQADDFRSAITLAVNDRDSLREMGVRARRYFDSTLDRTIATSAYRTLLNRLVNNG